MSIPEFHDHERPAWLPVDQPKKKEWSPARDRAEAEQELRSKLEEQRRRRRKNILQKTVKVVASPFMWAESTIEAAIQIGRNIELKSEPRVKVPTLPPAQRTKPPASPAPQVVAQPPAAAPAPAQPAKPAETPPIRPRPQAVVPPPPAAPPAPAHAEPATPAPVAPKTSLKAAAAPWVDAVGERSKSLATTVGERSKSFAAMVGERAAEIRRRREEDRRRQRQDILNAVRSMSWDGYLAMIADIFRREGYIVLNAPETEAAVIDMDVSRGEERLMVSCRIRGAGVQVTEDHLQHVLASVARSGATGAFFITDARVAPKVEGFARNSGIVLIEGETLIDLVIELTTAREKEKGIGSRIASKIGL